MNPRKLHPTDPDMLYCTVCKDFHHKDLFLARKDSPTGKMGHCKEASRIKSQQQRDKKNQDRDLFW